MALDVNRNFIAFDEARHEAIPLDDQKTAFEISATLNRHYPGHKFGVNVDSRSGIATIAHEADILAGNGMGYVLHLSKLNSDPTYDAAMRAGGEILERKGIARGVRRVD